MANCGASDWKERASSRVDEVDTWTTDRHHCTCLKSRVITAVI